MTVFSFDHAIVRTPARSVVDGLRVGHHDSPTYAGVMTEHIAYVGALAAAGLAVTVLPPLEAFPDSVFVEDPALVFGDTAFVLTPGAPTRAGEASAIRTALARAFAQVIDIRDGHVDGGDILVTPATVFIGLSARTDAAGAAALVRALARIGRAAQVVTPPPGVLHLKTGANLIDESTLLVTAPMAAARLFAGFECLVVGEGEDAAANALRLNDQLLVGRDFPRTIDRLAARGFNLVPLAVIQIGKIDAGLSCMSLRWLAPAASATPKPPKPLAENA